MIARRLYHARSVIQPALLSQNVVRRCKGRLRRASEQSSMTALMLWLGIRIASVCVSHFCYPACANLIHSVQSMNNLWQVFNREAWSWRVRTEERNVIWAADLTRAEKNFEAVRVQFWFYIWLLWCGNEGSWVDEVYCLLGDVTWKFNQALCRSTNTEVGGWKIGLVRLRDNQS